MQEDAETGDGQVGEDTDKCEQSRSDYGEQGANGYDLSLFRENLRRTPTERIERLQSAHNFFIEVKEARANRVSKSHRTDLS